MKKLENINSRRLGIAAVEMALCLPFILAILFGILEFHRLIQIKNLFNNAAREGCRYASQKFILDGNGNKKGITIDDVKSRVSAILLRNTFLNLRGIGAFENLTISFTTFQSNGNQPRSTSLSPSQLIKNDIYQIDISLSYEYVKFLNFDFGFLNPLVITGSARMICTANKELDQFNFTMPSRGD
jgi:Flp pilus assembly protein TadG